MTHHYTSGVSVKEQQLPSGWVVAQLAEASTIQMGQSPPSSTYNAEGTGLPFFQGKAEFGPLFPEVRVWCSRPGKIAEAQDILLSVRAPVGPTNLAPGRSCIGRGLAAIHPDGGLNLKYLFYAFRCFTDELDSKGTGTTFKAVSGKVVREFEIPVAPLPEQARIADALDELFSDLDAGVAVLERVRAKLKLYRASVLKAAVEGVLTAEWRARHPNAEPASELLERILVERRRRWEEDQLAKFKVKGQEPPKNWKAKYKEPAAPDTTNLPPLPEGWCWSTVGQLSSLITSGSRGWKEYYSEDGAIFIRSQDIRTDLFVIDDVAHVAPPRNSEGTRTQVHHGDILVTITGANVAKAALVEVELHEAYVSQHVGLMRLVDKQLGRYVHMFAVAPSGGRARLLKVAYGAGKPGLNLDNLRDLAVPLPSLTEQREIVEAVEDHLEADIDAKLKKAQSLRQSILRHAFTGRLVPQDPNDEQASELLKRIAAEREARALEATKANCQPRRIQGRKKRG